MRFGKLLAVVLVAAGAGTAVGGLYSFGFGYRLRGGEYITAEGWGELDGYWHWWDASFLGAVLSSVGVAVFVLGLWLALTPPSPEKRRRRAVVWVTILALAFGTLGAFLVSVSLTSGEPEAERDAALDVATDYVNALEAGRWKRELLTADYARRLDAGPERVAYHFGRWSLTDRSVRPGEVRVDGHVRASGKTITHTAEHGAMMLRVTFPERKRVGVHVRLVRGEGGRWRIDDVVFTEP